VGEPDRRSILEELRLRGFRPDRRRGQNFLFDGQLLEALIDDARLPEGASVVEIGAGAGTLTRRLLARGHRVVAVEIDLLLADYLRQALQPGRILTSQGVTGPADARFTLVVADALATKNRLSPLLIDALSSLNGPFALVANLPYAIASPVVQLLLELDGPEMQSIGALVQSEAAERWVSGPGSKKYGSLSVSLQLMGTGDISRRVGRQLFSPPPKVESAFFVWRRQPGRSLTGEWRRAHQLARRLFRQRRKMLRSILSRAGETIAWRETAIDPQSRPEHLTPEEFVELARLLSQSESQR